jgi:glycosyltransferase involved in cell wall biosynthesis
VRPQTSVIIPVFNGEAFINDAIASVLSELSWHDEVLVVDDGSTDRTRSVLDLSDSRVTLLDGPGSGPSGARNIGLARADGDFIAFLDHDDLWPSGRQEALKAALVGDTTTDAAAGRVLVRVEATGIPGVHLGMHGQHAPSMLSSCLYRRGLVERVGEFAANLRHGEDLDYHFRLVEAGMKLVFCEQDALIYRRHAGNATNSAPPSTKILKELLGRKLRRMRERRTTRL